VLFSWCIILGTSPSKHLLERAVRHAAMYPVMEVPSCLAPAHHHVPSAFPLPNHLQLPTRAPLLLLSRHPAPAHSPPPTLLLLHPALIPKPSHSVYPLML
jgi:hypothetical protein